MGHSRDQWNEEAALIAFQPWEVDLIDRGLSLLADLADRHPERYGLHGHAGEPARAIVDKLDQVLEYQGYGGLDGVRTMVDERRGDGIDATAF